jgi:hypothetical protein
MGNMREGKAEDLDRRNMKADEGRQKRQDQITKFAKLPNFFEGEFFERGRQGI